MRVAVYIRVSTVYESQTTSLENQEGGALEAIYRNNWVIYDIYKERQSGLKLEKRIEFMRLISDARQKKFNVVWVKSLTRFGRKIADLHRYVEELVRLDIRFIAEIENIDTNQGDWSTKLAMWSMFAQWESQAMSDRLRQAYRVKAGRGEFTGSFAPYGFVINDKVLYPATDGSVEIVKRIFGMYLDGVGPSSIAAILTKEGVPTPAKVKNNKNAGNYWHESSIRLILTNPVYTGTLVANKETIKILGDTKRIVRSPEEFITIENAHEAIITKKDFLAVQRQIKLRSKKHAFRKYKHLFSNLLYCEDCGSQMYRISRNWGRVHYVCGKYIRTRRVKCSRHTVYEEELASKVLFKLKDAGLGTKQPPNEDKKSARRLAEVEEEVKKNLRRKNRAQDLYIDGEFDKGEYHEFLDRIQVTLAQLQEELLELRGDGAENKSIKITNSDRVLIGETKKLTVELVKTFIKRVTIAADGSISHIDFLF